MIHVVQHLGHSFIPGLIQPDGVALDCGANNGAFAAWLSQNTRAVVYGFEPDHRLFEALPHLERVKFLPYAVAAKKGSISLNLGSSRCSSVRYVERENQAKVNVPAVQLEQFCREQAIESIELIKLDIEGAEIPVLLSASEEFLLKVKQITVEFHDFLSRDDIPNIRRIIARLKGIGFRVIKFSQFTFGDLLFVNGRTAPIGTLDVLQVVLFVKYGRGISRLIKRNLRIAP